VLEPDAVNAASPVLRGEGRSNAPLLPDKTKESLSAPIFAERQAGRTIAAIAEGFNVDGVPGPTGGRWVVSRVYGITTNPYYAGQVRFNARSTRATITTAAVDHPALVDEATFRRVSGAKVA
jgi:hypothetical protein